MWEYAIGIALIHALSLLALVPWFFSWTGVLLWFGGQLVFGTLGMTLGYHRLLTHRSFACSKWLEHVFTTIGVCCLEDTPARWVAIHRKHHQYSDEASDPHSPAVDFLWSHIGWLLVDNPEHREIGFYDRYARRHSARSFLLKHGTACQMCLDLLNTRRNLLRGRARGGLGANGSVLGRRAVWFEPVSLGSFPAHRHGLACHLVGQLAVAYLGISKLRDG